jgi:hypothetical protein
MSAKDDLKKSLGNEKEKVKGFLTYSVTIANLTPDAQRRLREIESEEKVIDILPNDIAEEIAGKILPIQLNQERKASLFYPQPSTLSDEAIQYMLNSSGSATVYVNHINTFTGYEFQAGNYAWVEPANAIFAELAEDVNRRNRIQNRLSNLNPELGESFKVAEDTYEKAKGGPNLVYQGVMGMRNVLQSFWGELTALARNKNPGKTKKFSGLQRKKEEHRKIVAECITDADEDRRKLNYHLNILNGLYDDMSQTEIGNNNLADDIPRMESLHTTWIILLSDIVGFI